MPFKRYESLFQWNEPEEVGNRRHEIGEIVQIDRKVIKDVDDLVANGTLRELPDESLTAVRGEPPPVPKPLPSASKDKDI